MTTEMLFGAALVVAVPNLVVCYLMIRGIILERKER